MSENLDNQNVSWADRRTLQNLEVAAVRHYSNLCALISHLFHGQIVGKKFSTKYQPSEVKFIRFLIENNRFFLADLGFKFSMPPPSMLLTYCHTMYMSKLQWGLENTVWPIMIGFKCTCVGLLKLSTNQLFPKKIPLFYGTFLPGKIASPIQIFSLP